ncbi:MAG TPA: SDR family oxidoreductase [Pseudonocardiaceae bacterium]
MKGRKALVTGVSRRVGIAFTVARRLAAEGAEVVATGWRAHDAEQPWGADELPAQALGEALRRDLPPAAGVIHYRQDDLADAAVPGVLVDEASGLLGGLDVLVATHARSSGLPLARSTAAELDLCWAVNVRATLLLVQGFAALRGGHGGSSITGWGGTDSGGTGSGGTGSGGRVVLFTSGQHRGAMPGELPYVVTKGALQQVTATLANELAPLAITVNCINPGPVDTGYADEAGRRAVAARMPFGRWGRPEDTANLIVWLVSDAGGWITGQTLVSDGGWSARG